MLQAVQPPADDGSAHKVRVLQGPEVQVPLLRVPLQVGDQRPQPREEAAQLHEGSRRESPAGEPQEGREEEGGESHAQWKTSDLIVLTKKWH